MGKGKSTPTLNTTAGARADAGFMTQVIYRLTAI